MEKNRRELKTLSILILALAALSFIMAIVNVCIDGFPKVDIAYISPETAKIVSIITWVLGLVIILPQVYVGVKVIKQANNPTGARAHIVWALILGILAAIATISSIVSIAKAFTTSQLVDLINVAIDTLIFATYYFYARKVAQGK